MSNPAPSSHPSHGPQPVNPYAASREREPQGLDAKAPEPKKHYQIRMTWADRRRFLRTVGPSRLYAAVGGVIGVWAVFGLLQASYELWWLTDLHGFDHFVFIVRLALSFARGLLALYVCRLYWQFADVIAAAAGGRSASMEAWSRCAIAQDFRTPAGRVITPR